MKTTLVAQPTPPFTPEEVRQILRDALGDFCRVRGAPFHSIDEDRVRAYVAERYAAHPLAFREAKVAEVTRRLEIALSLLRADVEVEP